MKLFRNLRKRLSCLVWAGIAAVGLVGCGLSLIFVLAPRQKLTARRLERLPVLTAVDVAQATPGDEVLVSGVIQSATDLQVGNFIAYQEEIWVVTTPDPQESTADLHGRWETGETVVPALTLAVEGGEIAVLVMEGARLEGPLHEQIIPGEGPLQAREENRLLADGTRRYRGLYAGDLVTVWGRKAASDGVLPQVIYAGDRVAFIDAQHQTAQILLTLGIGLLVGAPLVVIAALLSAVFGRWR